MNYSYGKTIKLWQEGFHFLYSLPASPDEYLPDKHQAGVSHPEFNYAFWRDGLDEAQASKRLCMFLSFERNPILESSRKRGPY